MTAKKTEKPKTKPKTKKKKTPTATAVDTVYRAVMTGNYQPTAERMATAQALITLRGIEIKKNDELEMFLWSAYRGCREKIVKTLINSALSNNLRLIDTQILIEMLKNEIAMISAWEYEHLDEADSIIEPTVMKEGQVKQSKTIELFKALGGAETTEEEEEQ